MGHPKHMITVQAWPPGKDGRSYTRATFLAIILRRPRLPKGNRERVRPVGVNSEGITSEEESEKSAEKKKNYGYRRRTSKTMFWKIAQRSCRKINELNVSQE